jgi:hypothetical protein
VNGRQVGLLGVLEVIRADEGVEVVASERLPSDVVLELAIKRCRHASHIRLGVTLAPRIMLDTRLSSMIDICEYRSSHNS